MLLPHAAGANASPLRSCQQRDASAGSGTEHDHPDSTPHVEEQLGKIKFCVRKKFTKKN
jgi:hypothetical protein